MYTYHKTQQFPLLSICLKEIKTYVYTKICTQLFIVALFTDDKNWKQFQCLKL